MHREEAEEPMRTPDVQPDLSEVGDQEGAPQAAADDRQAAEPAKKPGSFPYHPMSFELPPGLKGFAAENGKNASEPNTFTGLNFSAAAKVFRKAAEPFDRSQRQRDLSEDMADFKADKRTFVLMTGIADALDALSQA